jgi:sugar lactone lactonase YvrE
MISFKLNSKRPRISVVIAVLLAGACAASAGDAYKWSVQYLIDNSRTTFGKPQKVSPRHSRALAISPDGKYLYAGYHHSFGNSGEVRRIAIDADDYEQATVAVLPKVLAKAIATDDKGRVYICHEFAVVVYDAALKQRQLVIQAGVCEGLASAREGGQLVLYTTEREQGTISRFVMTEDGEKVTAATAGGFGENGNLTIPGAKDLRGAKLDARGNLWAADLAGGQVFRIAPGGKDVKSVPIKAPMDVAIDGKRVFVTQSTERAITVMDDEMNILGALHVPWEELELSPFGNNRNGALSGIVVLPGKGFFVSNEAGQTANQRSTYGQVDEHSGKVQGREYRDIFEDDNEPILRATEVESIP